MNIVPKINNVYEFKELDFSDIQIASCEFHALYPRTYNRISGCYSEKVIAWVKGTNTLQSEIK